MNLQHIVNTVRNYATWKYQRRSLMKATHTKPTIQIMCEVQIMEDLTSNPELRKQIKKEILRKETLRSYDHDMLRLIAIAEM